MVLHFREGTKFGIRGHGVTDEYTIFNIKKQDNTAHVGWFDDNEDDGIRSCEYFIDDINEHINCGMWEVDYVTKIRNKRINKLIKINKY